MYIVFFFFTQKTAYEMRISDWSSDVCSSDLTPFASSRVSPSNQLAQHRQRVRPHHRCSGELLTAAWIASRTGQYSAWPGATTSKWFAPATDTTITLRQEERRVGQECVGTVRYRWAREP